MTPKVDEDPLVKREGGTQVIRQALLEKLRGGLIVSCQSYPGEPLYEANVMAYMAQAGIEGGAVAIRANGTDIALIRQRTNAPIFGTYKRDYPSLGLFITPTLREVEFVVQAGADIITFDALPHERPDGGSLTSFISQVRKEFPNHLLMADISTVDEAKAAAFLGVDIVATTLSGYTSWSTPIEHGPDGDLVTRLVSQLKVPVIAEGRIDTPEQAQGCIQAGAFAVVVGSAITRPHLITHRFARALNNRV